MLEYLYGQNNTSTTESHEGTGVYAMGQTDHLLTATLPAWAGNVNVMLPTCG
jgi:hypothetical protein